MFDQADVSARRGVVTLSEICALNDQIAAVVARLQPDDVPLSQATECWKQVDQAANMLKGGATLLVRKVDESGDWKRAGCKDVAQFLAREGGIGLGDARRQRKASRQLEDLPDTTDQLRKGRLSAEQVELIADAATVNPEAEQGLLDIAAQQGVKDLRDECGRAKQRADRDPDATVRALGDETCEIPGIGPVPISRVREMLCESSIRAPTATTSRPTNAGPSSTAPADAPSSPPPTHATRRGSPPDR
jgi:hypothetical protein